MPVSRSKNKKPVKMDSLFAVIKHARNMGSYKLLLQPGCTPPPSSKDSRFQLAVKKVMGAIALVESLSSLDRKQMEVASDNARCLCDAGPARAMILHEAGIIPVLVDLLALEGLKNTKIVANSLFSLNVLAYEVSCCTELSNCKPLSHNLEALYRTDNKVYQQFAAAITCKVFNQLSNIGCESNLVLGVRERRSSSTVTVADFAPVAAGPTDESTPKLVGQQREGGLLGLLVRLLDSKNDHTLQQALLTIETLTYHFDNVVALCELNEPSLLECLVACLKKSDVEVVMKAAAVVSGIVCNGRLHTSVLKYARSGDLLGQLRATMDAFAEIDSAAEQTNVMIAIAKECLHNSMFDMYCSLPKERKRYHGPDSRREESLLKEANR